MSNTIPVPEVVIVGGGPVGLWTAIQLIKRCKFRSVVIHERNEEYIRSHVIRLDHISFLLYCRKSSDERERQFYEEVVGEENKLQPFRSVYVRTQTLENALRRYAVDLGVKIVINLVKSPGEIEMSYPDTRFFIAADGAKSRLRQSLLSPRDIIRKDLQHIIELKYESKGQSKPLVSLRDVYRTLKLLNSMAFEYVGKTENNITPVTLRFFLTEKLYHLLPEATFRSPLPFDSNELPAELLNDIQTYLNVRRTVSGEEYLQGSGKLTKLTLSAYRARKFSISNDTQTWFFVGDAAIGVPYFRALNCGIMCASLLAFVFRLCKRSSTRRALYGWFCTWRWLTEYTMAMSKHSLLHAIDLYRRFGSRVPWQTIKWSSEESYQYVTQEHYALLPDKKD